MVVVLHATMGVRPIPTPRIQEVTVLREIRAYEVSILPGGDVGLGGRADGFYTEYRWVERL